jgi:hypothetical protein
MEVAHAAIADRPPHSVSAYAKNFEAVVAGATDPEIEGVEVVASTRAHGVAGRDAGG